LPFPGRIDLCRLTYARRLCDISMPQRSPVIFWLLLAATLCVDAVAVSWAYGTRLYHGGALYFGLVCGQINLICIGACFSGKGGSWRWLAPFAVASAAAWLTSWLYEPMQHFNPNRYELAMAYSGLWMVQVAVLLAIVWLLHQTSFAERWGHQSHVGRWRFSVKHVLAVMTVLAVLIVVLRQAKLIHDFWFLVLSWVINNVGVAVAVLGICTSRSHIVLRLAAALGIAAILSLSVEMPAGEADSLAINLIQAIVMFVWLEISGIVPRTI